MVPSGPPAPGPQLVRADSPVLIIGTERSGSNLLRLVLNSHPHITVPHPPHFMHYFASLAPAYGDLRRDRNRRALVRDAQRLLRRHIHPWEHPIDEERVFAQAGPSVFGVVAAFYEEYRRAEGKPRWGCKSTFTVHHVAEVLAEYPRARFIWLVRDPRDVAASAKRSVFNHFHPYRTALLWSRQQELAAAALARHGPEVVHLLRYEDLVADPEPVLRRLCEFLDEPFEPAMLAHHRSPAAQRTARLSQSWHNTDRPINTDSVGRHLRGLSPTESRQVVLAAGPMMRRLGYATEAEDGAARPPSMARVRVHDLALRLRNELRSMRNDRNYRRRLVRDATVAWVRVRRRSGWALRNRAHRKTVPDRGAAAVAAPHVHNRRESS
ncbi:sulfotransferase family protein [Micromonospora maritima]|uniref:sulfotransferase family protein n=1 Tax=Micromonospora maritima TaxID=986711 RepID=UPI0037A44E71